jgi:hypothetical protein
MFVFIRCFIILSQCALALASIGGQSLAAQAPGNSQAPLRVQHKAHSNHNPQHGGVFFMALDNQHHLEGVLLESGIFKVYLYDAFTKPLSAVEVQQASASIQLGQSENAPKIPLGVAKDGRTLEVFIKELSLPVTITLSLWFQKSSQQMRPEVFTFPFSHYIAADAQR